MAAKTGAAKEAEHMLACMFVLHPIINATATTTKDPKAASKM